MPELVSKIEKYENMAKNAPSDVAKAQLMQLVTELKARLPEPKLKVHTTPEICESCQ